MPERGLPCWWGLLGPTPDLSDLAPTRNQIPLSTSVASPGNLGDRSRYTTLHDTARPQVGMYHQFSEQGARYPSYLSYLVVSANPLVQYTSIYGDCTIYGLDTHYTPSGTRSGCLWPIPDVCDPFRTSVTCPDICDLFRMSVAHFGYL